VIGCNLFPPLFNEMQEMPLSKTQFGFGKRIRTRKDDCGEENSVLEEF